MIMKVHLFTDKLKKNKKIFGEARRMHVTFEFPINENRETSDKKKHVSYQQPEREGRGRREMKS